MGWDCGRRPGKTSVPPRTSRIALNAALGATLSAAASMANDSAQARFLPPEGQRLRQVLIEERLEPGAPQRFTTERELIFRRTASGYAVTVTVLRADPPPGDTGAMFAIAMAQLRDQPIVLLLDQEGQVVAIENEAGVWQRLCAAIAAVAQGGATREPRRQAMLTAMIAMLERLPAARRRAILGSAVESIVAGPLADRQVGENAVTRPARAPGGVETMLNGRERVALSDGALLIDTETHGVVPGAPGSPATPAAEIALLIRQRVDAARGMVLEMRSERTTTLRQENGTPPRRARSVITSIILAPVS